MSLTAMSLNLAIAGTSLILISYYSTWQNNKSNTDNAWYSRDIKCY